MDNDLFDSLVDESQTGFRLNKFELYNWGTFNNDIWSIEPNGQNALLTGDIGSGKSTVVDAITTLLVAPQKITFNKAAGAQGKERSLMSYVKGYYKSEKNHHDLSAKPIPLRDGNSYSVILGYFYNKDFQKGISFAQVFWLKDDKNQPERFYISSSKQLSIAEHFSHFGDDIRKLKKRLKAEKDTKVFDQFKQYETDLKRQLGLNSAQALDLFYQTVSMKSVGNLTDFVRSHMLEKQPIEKTINAICSRFTDLDQAHKSVLKAKDKITLLQPINEGYKQYSQAVQQAQTQQNYYQQVPIYFAQIKQQLLEKKIIKNEEQLNKLIARIERSEKDIKSKDDERKRIEKNIYDNGGQRLDELKAQIEQKNNELIRRQRKAEHYTTYCQTVNLTLANTELEFQQNRNIAKQQIEETENSIQIKQKEATDNEIIYREKQQQEKEIQKELRSLSEQKSNINRINLAIREKLCQSLNIDTQQLPFVGELIQVREKHMQWQGAIERLMHNYALSLLVPDHLYKQVADYVNKTHLGGRLVYFKTSQETKVPVIPTNNDMLYHKLQFNSDSLFYDWLAADVINRFKYHCCEAMDDFKRNHYAISLFGQIKSGKRHEKDDRKALNNIDNFVLGWSNKQKCESYQKQLDSAQQQGQQCWQQVQETNKQITTLRSQKDSLQFLINIEHFNEIYWQRLGIEISGHKQEIEQIKQSSDQLALLEETLLSINEQLQSLNTSKDKQLISKGSTETTLNDAKNNINNLHQNFKNLILQDQQAIEILVKSILGKDKTTTINYAELHLKKVSNAIVAVIDLHNKKASNLSNKIVRHMQVYKDKYKTDSNELDSHIDSAKEFIDALNKLNKEDLPRHEIKFSDMLKTGTIQDIALLQSNLEKEQRNIKQKIDTINESLTEIEYNEGSYIILISGTMVDEDIRHFKQMLKKCISNAFDDDNIYNEQKFLNVKALINLFNGREGHSDFDKKWTKKVTDVRNWFVFSASERWKEDDSEKEHFSDSSGKSGGQKEKLAYTVLASALAYQFGLKWGESKSKSFRFVMIDEAFGKGSDESTHYALELFKKLNLQLLIVTPLQKINVIEGYIKNLHYVSNPDGKCSELNTFTIEKFKKLQQQKQKQMLEQTLG